MRQQIYWTQRGTQLNHLIHAVTFLTGARDEIQMNNTGKNRQLLINSQIKSNSNLLDKRLEVLDLKISTDQKSFQNFNVAAWYVTSQLADYVEPTWCSYTKV